jgi:hypothetical protein
LLALQHDSKETMYRYLLGRCTKQEQLEVESAYLRDGTLFESLMKLESSVISAYRRGELSTEDRADIEKHLLAQHEKRQRKRTK